MAAILGFGNSVNDFRDRELDKDAKPWRPLASERVSAAFAIRLAVLLALLALLVGVLLGGKFVVLVPVMLAVSWAYSYFLKSTVMIGHIVVAGLSAATVVAGAVAVVQDNRSYWFIAASVGLMVLAIEVVKAIEDQDGDRDHGIHTVAHVLTARRQRFAMVGLGAAYAVCLAVGLILGLVNAFATFVILALPAVPYIVLPILDHSPIERVARRCAQSTKLLWPFAIVGALIALR